MIQAVYWIAELSSVNHSAREKSCWLRWSSLKTAVVEFSACWDELVLFVFPVPVDRSLNLCCRLCIIALLTFLFAAFLFWFFNLTSGWISGKFSSRKDLTSLRHKVSILSWNKGRAGATFKGKQKKGKTPHNVIFTFKEFCTFYFFTAFKACNHCLVNSRWNDIEEKHG